MSVSNLIEIVSYKKDWPIQFQQAKLHLADTLHGLYVSIDHIGSTSVPDLRAKDRIDIQITVAEISENLKKQIDGRLIKQGFGASSHNVDHRPPGDKSSEANWQKLYLAGVHRDWVFTANIHFRKIGHANWRYPILFRDYLCAHPNSAEAYARAKEKLAQYLAHNRNGYSDAKDPICDLIMIAAEEWALRTSWSPVLADFR